MANYNLTSQKIKDTYEQLVQVSGSALVDGTGSAIVVNVDSASFAATASYAENASSDWNDITNKPSGIVSSSAQTLENVKGQTIEPTEISGAFGTIKSRLNFLEIKPENGSSLSGVRIGDEDLSNYVDITSAGTTFYGGNVSAAQNFQATDITATGRYFGVDFDDVENKPSGLVSSSAQTIANISGSTIYPSSVNAGVVTATTPVTGFIGDLSGDVYADDVSTTTLTASNALISGDLTVNGTGSFAYIQSVTGSAKIIGDAFIILNADTPSQRYAGVKVYDSGSSPVSTGSLQWDSVNNDWFYEYQKDATDYAVALFGPEFSTKGTPTYLTTNTIPKAAGGHHLADSSITDTGTSVSMSAPLTASGFQGDLDGTATSASFAITASYALNAGLETGNSGTDSIKTAASLTTTAAEVNGPQSIAIGNAAKVSGTASLHISLDDSNTFAAGDQTINIGKDINNTGGYSTAIGHNLTNTGTGGNVLIGRSVTTAGDYSIGIGEGAQAQQASGVAIGQSARSSGNSVAIGAGAIMGNSYGFAGGYNATANNDASIAIGGDVSVSSNQAIAIGTDTSIDASSQGAVSFGQNADIATSTRAVVIGQGAGATGANNAIAIGSGSKVTAAAEINIGNRFKYDGTSTITLDASLIKVAVSASATGSLIDNVHPAIASGSPAIQHIVTIDQTAYNTISGSGNVSNDTFYIISDAGDDVYPGNLQVDGQIYSPTFAGTIASSTSSIDFDNGNFATLNCASSTFLANPTNLQGGTTYTLIVTNGANISGYGTAWKFAGGTEPTLSANTDVITAVSDGTSLYAAALADFS